MLNFVCLLKLNCYIYIYNCFLFSSLSTKQVLFIIHGFYYSNLHLSTNFITSLYRIITHGFDFCICTCTLVHFYLKIEQKMFRVLTFAFDLEVKFCLLSSASLFLFPFARTAAFDLKYSDKLQLAIATPCNRDLSFGAAGLYSNTSIII